MPWKRPENVPYPNVWWSFEATDPDRDDGALVTYRVEDLTEDRYEDAIKLYTEHFLDDEPLCAYGRVRHNELSYEEIVKFWNYVFDEHITIACYKEGSKELIKSESMQKLVAVNEYMTDTVNLFEKFGVDKYLTAYGLSVNGRYRGRGIATEILKARRPICRAFGLRLTSTNFTAIGSQIPAAKIGFITDLEMPYDEFVKVDPTYTFQGIKSKSIKLMSLVVE
uniref:N-acetyltransferase domain-containing protein n=1 Tax=Anopheles farauti TaxID=69004 RepID=A0A182QW05_9DIPT